MSDSLAGKTVVVTRAAHQQEAMASLLESRGARAVRLPTIEIVALADDADSALGRLDEYDGVLLTSSNAVLQLMPRVPAAGLGGAVVFAIGEATAQALREAGVAEVVVASRSVGEGLVEAVCEHFGARLGSMKLLLPRAKEGREAVIDGLRSAGASVDVVALYETVPVTRGPGLPEGVAIDWVTFTSPSSVRGFAAAAALPAGAKVACIGPVTAEAARAAGMTVDVVADSQSVAALVDAIARCSS